MCVLVLVLLPALVGWTGQPPQLAATIWQEGIRINDAVAVPVSRPVLEVATTVADRMEIAKKLAPRMPWERFSKDSVLAPVMINTDAIKDDDGKRVAHSIRSTFIVYAPLEDLRNQELMEAVLLNGEDPQSDEITAAGQQVPVHVLESLGITRPQKTANDDSSRGDSYGVVTLPLMNRVQLTGVIWAEKFSGNDHLGVVWKFDDRFAQTDYACKWQKMTRNQLGEPELGEPVPYVGCGGYIAVYEIDRAANMLLVESRIVMHEPDDWFGGSQFLRSKLPAALQENAWSFRRKIAASKPAEKN